MIARRVLVHGMVQGVGFRWSMANEARRLGVTGWVRNRDDGAVEAQLEGDPAAVAALVDWSRTGPRWARVTGVDTHDAHPTGAMIFDVEP